MAAVCQHALCLLIGNIQMIGAKWTKNFTPHTTNQVHNKASLDNTRGLKFGAV